MTFEDWYIENEIKTYDKTEYDCMKMTWNAAIDAALAAWNEVDAEDIVCLKSS